MTLTSRPRLFLKILFPPLNIVSSTSLRNVLLIVLIYVHLVSLEIQMGVFSVNTVNNFANICILGITGINDNRREQQGSFKRILKWTNKKFAFITSPLSWGVSVTALQCHVAFIPDGEMVRDRRRTWDIEKKGKSSHWVLFSWVSLQVCDQHISIRLCSLWAGLSVISAGKSRKPLETRSVPLVHKPHHSYQQGKDEYSHQHCSRDDAMM